jgi:hypothetical protein
MTALTLEAARALAVICLPTLNDPQMTETLRDVVLGLGLHESRLNPAAINTNPNGTVDRGMLQINSSNLARVGLTPETAFDPCNSLRAGGQIFLEALSIYNTGSPSRGISNGYVVAAMEAIRAARGKMGAAVAKGTPDLAAAAAFPRPQPITLKSQLSSFAVR